MYSGPLSGGYKEFKEFLKEWEVLHDWKIDQCLMSINSYEESHLSLMMSYDDDLNMYLTFYAPELNCSIFNLNFDGSWIYECEVEEQPNGFKVALGRDIVEVSAKSFTANICRKDEYGLAQERMQTPKITDKAQIAISKWRS